MHVTQLTDHLTQSEAITRFLDSPTLFSLIFYLNGKEDLFAATAFPPQLKKKSLYFLKKTAGAITDLVDNAFVTGDLPVNPLEYLSGMLEEVYVPLLTNPKNMENVPSVVATEVVKQLQTFSGAVHIITGKSKAKTVLPIPEQVKGNLSDAEMKSHLHLYESSIITWTHSVQELLKQSSSSLLDSYAGPIVAIEFWEARSLNLSYLQEQLTGETIQRIGRTLESSGSSYYAAFKIICDDVNNGK